LHGEPAHWPAVAPVDRAARSDAKLSGSIAMPQLVSGVVVVQVSAPKTVVPWLANWSVRRLSKGDELTGVKLIGLPLPPTAGVIITPFSTAE
jgi:hypothetical protein